MSEGSLNTTFAGCATTVLVYGPESPPPDLTVIVQFLLDDLCVEGWRVSRLWLGRRGAHMVFDTLDLTLALLDSHAIARRLDGAMRPARPPGSIRPDPLRARLSHRLLGGSHGLSITLRPTTLAAANPDTRDHERAELARLCLLPTVEAAEPDALYWHPRRLLLGVGELVNGSAETLLAAPDPETALTTGPQPPRCRPRDRDRVRPAHPRVIRPRPHTRAQRAARASAGRLFGPPGSRPSTPLPRPDRALARLAAALRNPDPHAVPVAVPARAARAYAVTAQWIVLLPYLLGVWLPYA